MPFAGIVQPMTYASNMHLRIPWLKAELVRILRGPRESA